MDAAKLAAFMCGDTKQVENLKVLALMEQNAGHSTRLLFLQINLNVHISIMPYMNMQYQREEMLNWSHIFGTKEDIKCDRNQCSKMRDMF